MREHTYTARKLIRTGGMLIATLFSIGCSDNAPNGKGLYNQFCATNCHGVDNLGTPSEGVGPVDATTFQAITDAIKDVSEMNVLTDIGSLSNNEIHAIAIYIPTISAP